MGQYDEEMKKKNKTILKEYYSNTSTAIKKHLLTYSGWLRFVKKLSNEEISDLRDDVKKNDDLLKEYEIWMGENK